MLPASWESEGSVAKRLGTWAIQPGSILLAGSAGRFRAEAVLHCHQPPAGTLCAEGQAPLCSCSALLCCHNRLQQQLVPFEAG